MVRCMLQTVHAVLVLHQPCMPSRCRLGNFKDDVGLFNVILCLSLSQGDAWPIVYLAIARSIDLVLLVVQKESRALSLSLGASPADDILLKLN
jgi:hypothetical protein